MLIILIKNIENVRLINFLNKIQNFKILKFYFKIAEIILLLTAYYNIDLIEFKSFTEFLHSPFFVFKTSAICILVHLFLNNFFSYYFSYF